MKLNTLWMLIAVSTVVVGCGGDKQEQAEDARSTLAEIARMASPDAGLEEESKAVDAIVTGGGYETRSFTAFPSQEVGKKGRILIYANQSGTAGGAVYATSRDNVVSPAWHWYFPDDVPETVENVELNDDGLWDVRVVTKKGKTYEFIQDRDFTMMGPDRQDWIAQNGESSPAATDGAEMWRCFDGDSSTVWQSTVGGGKKAFLEVPVPFGVADGVLALRTTESGQPQKCSLYADGTKVQDFELEGKAGNQTLQLDPGVVGAHTVRVEFNSAYSGDVVAVAEMSLK